MADRGSFVGGFQGPARKAGWLDKKRRMGRRRCYCQAFDGRFVFFKSSGDANCSNQAAVCIPLGPESVIESVKNTFNIESGPSCKYSFIAESEALCKDWVDILRMCATVRAPSKDEQFYKDDGETIGIFVKAFLRWEEHQCVVVTTALYPRSPVKDLMQVIRETPSLGFPISEQHLMFGRLVLDPNHTLEYYGIKGDDVIVVVHNVPIITDAISVTDILTRLASKSLRLPSQETGCVGWSDRKQEHYHIYWSRGQWASRAQPTLSVDQKREIRTSGAKSFLTQNLELASGSPSPQNRIYLTDRDSNMTGSPPQLSLSLSSRSPSLGSPPLLSGRSSSSGNNPAIFHAGGVIRASLSTSNRSPSPGSTISSPNPPTLCLTPPTPLSRLNPHTLEPVRPKAYDPVPYPINVALNDPLNVPLNDPLHGPLPLNGPFSMPLNTSFPFARRSDPNEPRLPERHELYQHQEGVTWKRGKILGKGAWGTVYEALDIQSGALMAVKQVPIKLDDEEKQKQAQALKREIATMMALSHENIVRILGSEIKDDKISILMEYVPGASLSTQLKQFGPFSEEFARKYTRQLVEALVYCHGAGVVHRDIKGANILATLNGNPKLADFGSAKRLVDVEQKESLSEDFTYTTEWTAPEVFSQGEFNSKVDIWSLGCVIIEMITAQAPWAEHKFNNREQAMVFIGSSRDIPAIPHKLSAQGQEFLLRCLTRDPSARATARELLEHPWIADVHAEQPRRSVSSISDRPRSYMPPSEVISAAGALANRSASQ